MLTIHRNLAACAFLGVSMTGCYSTGALSIRGLEHPPSNGDVQLDNGDVVKAFDITEIEPLAPDGSLEVGSDGRVTHSASPANGPNPDLTVHGRMHPIFSPSGAVTLAGKDKTVTVDSSYVSMYRVRAYNRGRTNAGIIGGTVGGTLGALVVAAVVTFVSFKSVGGGFGGGFGGDF